MDNGSSLGPLPHARRRPRIGALMALAIVSAAATACEGEHALDDVEAARQGITGATQVSNPHWVVALSGFPSGCTGTLYTSQWILTAAHCVPNWDTNGSGSISSTEIAAAGFAPQIVGGPGSTGNSTARVVDRIVKHPESTFGSNTGSDSALIHVTQPFNIPWLVANKSAGKYYTNNILNIDTTSPPAGTVFDTYGYSTTWLGTGKAALQQLFTGWYTTKGVNGTGDSCGGDSGGPDFRVTSTKAYHFGIHSNGGCGNGGNSNIRTRYIQPWIKSTTGT